MEKNILTCTSPEFGTIEAIVVDMRLWYFGKQAADPVGLSDPQYRAALKKMSAEDIRRKNELTDECDPYSRRAIYVSAKGLDVIAGKAQDAPRAMRFRDWICGQIMPEGAEPSAEDTTAEPGSESGLPDTYDPSAELTNPVLKFTNEMFGEIRVVEIDGEPWFVGKDVAVILGYTNPNEAISDHVEEYEKLNSKSLSSFKINLGQRGGWLINESGLYSLIISSKLPTAREFKYWITSEILPSIRKHGAYLTDEVLNNILADPDFGIRLLTEIKEERERNRVLTEENNRLAAAYNALSEKAVEWKDRAVLSALVKSYSANTHGSDFSAGWNDFYRNLNYDLGINLRLRASVRNGGKLLDALTRSELCSAVRMVACMCRRAGRSRSPPKSAASV